MYYSDDSSGSESKDDVPAAYFPSHMLSQYDITNVENPQYTSSVDQFSMPIVSSNSMFNYEQDQYSDMGSDHHEYMADLYSDMDDSGESSEFDANINYSEMFPVEEYEVRSTQMVVNSRIEIDNVDLIGGRNQDYLGLARDYKVHRCFSDPFVHPSCVLCHKGSSEDVFFPCEHRCVCRACIQAENFCDERDMPIRKNGYNICPLCANVIKYMVPFDKGREVERYWEWVEEIAPPLPPGFSRKFNRSAEVLLSVYVDKIEHDIIEESLCKQN